MIRSLHLHNLVLFILFAPFGKEAGHNGFLNHVVFSYEATPKGIFLWSKHCYEKPSCASAPRQD